MLIWTISRGKIPAFWHSMGLTLEKFGSVNWWRWLSIIFMGISVRFTIDVIFGLKYRNYEIQWDNWEYLKAIILALILLEGIRWINRYLAVAK